MSGHDTDEPVRFDHEDAKSAVRKRRALYVTFEVIVAVIVALSLFEAVIGSPVYGVDTETTTATQAGTRLEVRYATATRGQLAVPLEVTVSRQGGFSEAVVLTVSSDYFDIFRTPGAEPDPSSETATGDDLILTFDPPPGDTLAVRWDLEAQPISSFTTATAHIAVIDSRQQEIVAVDVHTKVRP